MSKDLPNKTEYSELDESSLISDVCVIIETTRTAVARQVNSGITVMYWQIGNRINREVLGNQRAEYGKEIVSQLATHLTERYGRSEENGEESPIGMLFCTEGSDEQIELLQLDESGVKPAKYFTELPSREVFQEVCGCRDGS